VTFVLSEKKSIAINGKKAVQRQSHPLVQELWALAGGADRDQVRRITDESGLPLKWVRSLPNGNGHCGAAKLENERNVLVLRDRKSSFIDQFQHPLGRCAKFYKLSSYNNCNFWCEYCYLYLTFRNAPVSTHFVNYARMFAEIEAFERSNVPTSLRILNLGELGDPLAVDDITGFSKQIVPFVAQQAPTTKLLFLTKSDGVGNLLDLEHGGRTIVSFSVNTAKVHEYMEHRTPDPMKRLEAAKKVQDAGYEVRLRIDPVFEYSTWEVDYKALVDQIFAFVSPFRITIGEYRPATGLIRHIEDRFPDTRLLKINGSLVAEAGKLRYPPEKRQKMFKTIIDAIRKRDRNVSIALCKENAAVWKNVGLNSAGLCCNCLG
jgi:spore photoproduct lyase